MDVLFVDPLVVNGQCGAQLGLGEVEVGHQDAVGEHVLHAAGEWGERAAQVG